MIICASRRTDIPAFHAEWLINRLRAGYAMVRNPICDEVVYRVDLDRRSAGCLYFISKDPRPILPYLDEIIGMGYDMIFQVTITPYGRDLEPGVPDKGFVADAFREISEKIGMERTIWRYDPVIIDERHNMRYHERKFRLLCSELSDHTERCIFSFLDMYPKFEELKSARPLSLSSQIQREDFMRMAGAISKEHGIRASLCCSSRGYPEYGIDNRGCIDRETMISLGVPFEDAPGNIRDGCRCVRNIDIGAYDTCMHNCVYCYANRAAGDRRASKIYDPESEMLYGKVRDTDTVTEITERRSRITDF
ncbi:MAG: DUF1848 domain-containing protein [Candidatus Methanomethylophilaceae archaeon]